MVALLGTAVLAGWALDIPALKSVFPGLVTMKPNTALGFVLAAASLRLSQRDVGRPWARRAGWACASGAAFLGLLTLVEYAFALELRIDRLLFADPSSTGTSHPGRMSPLTALCFAAYGGGLWVMRTRRGLSDFLAVATGTIAALALVGYLYSATALYGVASYTEMALHSTLGFVLLSLGLLFTEPDQGHMELLTSDTSGGAMARRLLPRS